MQTRYFASVFVGLIFGALAGALIGFVLQQASGQEGWALLVGALGANAGATWAALRRAEGRVVWGSRAGRSAEHQE